MRILRSVGLALTASAIVASTTVSGALYAAEPYRELLQGLRNRGYQDYAFQYLDVIENDPYAPREIKELIPFEKASTLLTMARGATIKNPDVQKKQLEQALGFLEEFVKASPNHAMAGEANTERARILLGRARVEVWESRSPNNKENRATFQESARALVKQARAIFQTANDQHKATWEAFPKYINETEDPKQFQARAAAETKYMLAQLDLANATYEEAQTYDKESAEYKAKLREASKEYEEMHDKYRSQVAGLYARTWQGKCFEEQGEIGLALGIYKELLAHPGKSSTMVRMQDQVRQFELICLNHDQRKDYQLVIDKASEWLANKRGGDKFSQVSLGIRWEQILAQEALASDRSLSEPQRTKLRRAALTTVQTVARFPGQYKDLAKAKERDLKVQLQGEDSIGDPEDFDTAYSLAQDLVTRKTKELVDKLKQAQASRKADDIRAAKEDLDLHLNHTIHLLRIALRLADKDTPINDVNLARYYMAYMHLLARHNYEAAILAEYVATHYGKDNPGQAQDAAYMAMASYVQSFNDDLKIINTPGGDAEEKIRREGYQQIDVARMQAMADLLVERWPASDRSMDARMQMGSVLNQLKRFEEAADWFSRVPESASKYTDAQTQAGQSYWSAYIDAAQKPSAEQPAQAQLTDWMAKAAAHLRSGIERAEKETPPATAAPDSLIAAKVSLVQILVAGGDYATGIATLTGAPHPVLEAIQVEDETKRPTGSGTVKSVPFASLTYQLLLRCYVGTNKIDEAQAAMQTLEKIGGGGGEALTEIYRQLGEELEKELKQLKSLNQTEQLAKVRLSFETFLDQMFKRKAQTVGSLTWIGTTYYSLAKGSVDDPAESANATKYFNNASATFQEILNRAKDDPKFIDPARLPGVRLRLVNCQRSQGNFEEALTLVKEVITENKQNLDAQIEANYVYQDWGASGQGDSWKHYETAILGDKATGIWGWGQTALRLQRLLDRGDQESKDKYEDKFYEARYNVSLCRIESGENQTGAKMTEAMEKAKSEITSFVAITSGFGDKWWPKFDELYIRLQKNLGVLTPVQLERPKEIIPAPKPKPTPTPAPKPPVEKIAKKKDDGGTGMTYAMLGIAAFIGLAGGGFFVMKGSKGRKPSAAMAMGQVDNPVIGLPPAAPPKRRRPATAPTPGAVPAPQRKSAAQPAAEGEKPKRPLTPEEKERILRQRAAKAKAAEQAKKQKPE